MSIRTDGLTVTGTGQITVVLPFTPKSIRTEGLSVTGTGVVANVPLELDNVPAVNRQLRVKCFTRVEGVNSAASTQNEGVVSIPIPENGNYRGVVGVTVRGSKVDAATHYRCLLGAVPGQPALTGQNIVSGVIPR